LKKLGAYKTFLFLEGSTGLLLPMIFTASAVYQITVAGLSPLQLVLVGTTLEASVFLFEVPTGVVADVYSRRLSIIIGMFLIGLGFIVEGSFPLFWTILLAQVLWGVGYTFTSGATQAWISDEIGEAAAGRAFLRANQLSNIAALAGIGAGMALGNLRVNIPILLGGVGLMLLGVALILIMPETGFAPASRQERTTWQSMVHTFRQGLGMVQRRPALKTILVIGLIYGLYSEGVDRLWTKHLLDNFTLPLAEALEPVVWIGVVRAVAMLLSVGSTEIVRRRINTDSPTSAARILLALTAFLVLSLVGFALAPTLVIALGAYWLVSAMRSAINPTYTAWVNQRLDPRVRATVLSMSGQVDAIGQVVGGPAVGSIGNLFSVRAALLASSLILTPSLALYGRILRRAPETTSPSTKGSDKDIP
jgi:DHA3 family tetracycline resistance protein-like MFS transporter